MKTFVVFDVESIGLHGEGYAVAYVVREGASVLEEGMWACHPDDAKGEFKNRNWVDANIPPLHADFFTPEEVREAFWNMWLRWKEKGAWLAADCLWPVEARFLITCIEERLPASEWDGPYPFIDIGSVLLGIGMDPLQDFERLSGEEDKHHPLHDARQSARLLIEALS